MNYEPVGILVLVLNEDWDPIRDPLDEGYMFVELIPWEPGYGVTINPRTDGRGNIKPGEIILRDGKQIGHTQPDGNGLWSAWTYKGRRMIHTSLTTNAKEARTAVLRSHGLK